MKFMIINRPTGHDHDMEDTPDNARAQAASIQTAIDGGEIEAAYVLLSGGHAYVIEAANSGELTEWVRLNPLFKKSSTEILPIAGAVEWLQEYADYIEKSDLVTA